MTEEKQKIILKPGEEIELPKKLRKLVKKDNIFQLGVNHTISALSEDRIKNREIVWERVRKRYDTDEGSSHMAIREGKYLRAIPLKEAEKEEQKKNSDIYNLIATALESFLGLQDVVKKLTAELDRTTKNQIDTLQVVKNLTLQVQELQSDQQSISHTVGKLSSKVLGPI